MIKIIPEGFRITLHYGPKSYVVTLRPCVKRSPFEVVSVQHAGNHRRVTGDLTHILVEHATRELSAHLVTQHRKRFEKTKLSLGERLKLSLLVAQCKGESLPVCSLLHLSLAIRLSKEQYVSQRIEARKSGHICSELNDISHRSILQAQTVYGFSDEYVPVYISIITRAFAWHRGVPYKYLNLQKCVNAL